MISLKKSDLNIAIFSLGISCSYVSLAAESFDPAIDGLLRGQQRQNQLEKII